ncbi:MAG: hypothetical protein ABIR12_03045 [Ilumatobacteraceae bacterium]
MPSILTVTRRATTYVALINSFVLLVVTAFVTVGGVRRLVTHTPEIHGLGVLVVSLSPWLR